MCDIPSCLRIVFLRCVLYECVYLRAREWSRNVWTRKENVKICCPCEEVVTYDWFSSDDSIYRRSRRAMIMIYQPHNRAELNPNPSNNNIEESMTDHLEELRSSRVKGSAWIHSESVNDPSLLESKLIESVSRKCLTSRFRTHSPLYLPIESNFRERIAGADLGL